MLPVLELRVALTVDDYERIVALYRDGLGLEQGEIWTDGDSKGTIFEMGKATLEIFNEAHADKVDQLEVGRRVSGQIRFALQVPDVDAAVARLVANGVTLVHEPIVTPWNHRNARLQTPDGLQVTLFQVL
ncbi:MAG: VOC family protein [Armatimonadetes bacterium]|nr:VOC family protein [Anaerolineae bacterium]